jgi:hypothetical protein
VIGDDDWIAGAVWDVRARRRQRSRTHAPRISWWAFRATRDPDGTASG